MGRQEVEFDAERKMDDVEISQLLEELKDEGPSAEALSETARGEVERILSVKRSSSDWRFVLGGGTLFEQEREFQRLLKLLHPNEGYVSGNRAALALRRVVDAHK